LETIEKWISSAEKLLKLPEKNWYLRKFLYQHIRKNYPKIYTEKIEENDETCILLAKFTQNEVIEKIEKNSLDDIVKLRKKLGLTHIFAEIQKNNKVQVFSAQA